MTTSHPPAGPPHRMRSRLRRLMAVSSCAVMAAGTLLVAVPAEAAAAAKFKRADTGARILSHKWVNKNKTMIDVRIQSPSLGSTQRMRLIVPKGWKFKTLRTWPVVYALHGGRDSYVSWTRSTDVHKIARKYKVIVVMPEGANGSYTNWFNYGKGGTPKWEDFHLREVRQLAERNYNAGASRAIMGNSSGAQGACTYPGRAPMMFRYAACFSGVLSMQSPGIPALLMYTNAGNDQDPYSIWGIPWLDRANWDAHDPIKLLPRMRRTKFYVSAGTSGRRGPLDNPNKAFWDIGYLSELPIGGTSKEFVARAKQLRINITANIYADGSHSWPYWQREMHRAWPKMMAAIGARKA